MQIPQRMHDFGNRQMKVNIVIEPLGVGVLDFETQHTKTLYRVDGMHGPFHRQVHIVSFKKGDAFIDDAQSVLCPQQAGIVDRVPQFPTGFE